MISFTDTLVVIGMFLVRFGIPVAITAGVVYLLKRLDRRWEEEARLSQPVEKPVEQPAARKPAERPVAPTRVPTPTPQLPFIIPPAKQPSREQPGLMAAPQLAQPCWDVRGCSDAKKAECAAPKHPGTPCWQARLDAEGQVPEDCVSCDIFQRFPMM